jgi:hypothetical protein
LANIAQGDRSCGSMAAAGDAAAVEAVEVMGTGCGDGTGAGASALGPAVCRGACAHASPFGDPEAPHAMVTASNAIHQARRRLPRQRPLTEIRSVFGPSAHRQPGRGVRPLLDIVIPGSVRHRESSDMDARGPVVNPSLTDKSVALSTL